ncbi:MAG: SAM-dependent methyltransferase [Xanthomonadales bacterium]|nr:SAM-dependent methyltransferase [Xanthomonadales bacterium]MBK7146877.1 SAM-dependent methyltransferase [Xanthomonadales bacterium]
MDGNSPQVTSAQSGLHPRLDEIVQRHREHAWRAPLHAPSVAQFGRWLAQHERARPLVLDLGCGHGDSSVLLAQRHEDAIVLGIDQSAHRLSRLAPEGFAVHDRVVLMRAEGATLLRLLAAQALPIERLYLLYPNPWPKPEHLMRRWHGHPVLPILLANARGIVLRSNWRIYAEEFARAAALCGRRGRVVTLPADAELLTPFERKYAASGHPRHELSIGDA